MYNKKMAEYFKGMVRQATPGKEALAWQRLAAWAGNEIRFSSVSEVDITLDTSKFHITLPQAGTETFRVDGKPFSAQAGEYFIFNPQQHVRAEGAFKKPVEGYCLFLTEKAILETAHVIGQPIESALDSPFSYPWQQQEFMVKSYCLQENPFGQYLLRLQQNLRHSSREQLIDWDTLYFEMAAEFLRAHRQIGNQLQAIPSVRTLTKQEIYRRLSRAHVFILENFAEPVSLEDLERIAFFSKFHIVRLYRQIYGLTPYQHILHLRIGRAKELLRKDHSPTEVALRLSFSDRRAFAKTFKKIAGVSPSVFRQEN
ncbi:MAG: helix-turn-helix transcriptional regulator [Phaeodactylibacter sp.]|nr:helix-turn-helix transcriptional regulator [Phaeodactylibacter sp.]